MRTGLHKYFNDRNIATLLLLYCLGLAAWLLANGIRVTQEDGFYYFQIAKNIALGKGSTFDGLNLTNGYHPLWLLFLVPVFWLAPAADTALFIGTVLQVVFLGGAVVLLYYTARLTVGRFAASLAAILWVMFVYRVSLGGLEFSVHSLCVLVTAYLYLRWFTGEVPPPPRTYFGLGLLLCLAFLARLDTILLAGTISVFLVSRELRARLTVSSLNRLFAYGIPLLIVCVGYMLWNLWFAGHPWPVSSAVKRDWSSFLLSNDQRYQEHGWLAAKGYYFLWPLLNIIHSRGFYITLGTFGIAGFWLLAALGPRTASWRGWLMQVQGPWHPFLLYSFLSFLVYLSFYHWDLIFQPHYYVIQPWLAVLLTATFVDKLIRMGGAQLNTGSLAILSRRLVVALVAILWCGATFYTVRSLGLWQARQLMGVAREPQYDAAQWMKANLPRDAVVGAWNAGTVGYLSGRRVVNLDGVVNSWDFHLAKRFDLCRYWQEVGITYLVDTFEENQALSAVPTYPYYAKCVDHLELIWSDNRYGTPWRVEAYRVRWPDR